MKLWILQKPSPAGPAYEELRFREEARVLGIDLEVVSPDEIDLIVTQGGLGENFPVDEAIDVLARDCAHTLGLEIAGIDLLFDGDGYRVCEANSNPGFSGFEAATGANVARQMLQHCHWRIRRQLAVLEPAALP